MKKIVLLCFVLILVAIPFFVISGSSKSSNRINYYPNLKKDAKWEYVKERVFDGETEKVHKYSGPILVELASAHSADSIALESVFNELRELLPHKEIDYFRNYTGTPLRAAQNDDPKKVNGFRYSSLKVSAITLFISEVESKKEAYTLDDKRFLKAVKPNGHYTGSNLINNEKRGSGFYRSQFTFKFHQSQSVKERQEILRFYLVRMISCASLFKERINGKFDVKGAMLNSNKPSSWHLDFTEYDKFLLQKLYSPTLLKEYRAYMFKTYPWRFASSFTNKEKTKTIANWARSILALLLFFLAFNLLYKRQYKIEYMEYFFPILIILICFQNINFLYSYLITTGNHFNLEQYFLSLLAYLPITIIFAFVLWVFDKYVVKKEMGFTMAFILKVSFTLLVFLYPLLHALVFSNKINNWSQILTPLFALGLIVSVGRGILLYLDHFSENLIKQKDMELSRLKAANAEAEVRLLQSQINPHFLYNALNSIASLAQTDGAKTEKMALSLSDLFKYSINRKGKKSSTIGDEVDMVKNYLEVEQIRFGDRLTFQIHVDDNLKDIKIPMFLIQPLIENAVKHGVSKIDNHGKIGLRVSKLEADIVIAVHDNGPDFPEGLVSGHGLQTVYDLLRLSYGNNASLSWVNAPDKKIIITINYQIA